MDGKPNDPAWENALLFEQFFQQIPNHGVLMTQKTKCRIIYDEKYLYFCIESFFDSTSNFVANEFRRDGELDNTDDYVEIVLDTYHDERNGYHFRTNPNGVKYDAQFSNGGKVLNKEWDAIWLVNTSIQDTVWIAEIGIPFKTVKFDTKKSLNWGFNVGRRIGCKNEIGFLSSRLKYENIYYLNEIFILQFQKQILSGKNISLSPYICLNH